MRGLKVTAILCLIVLLGCIGFAGYLFMTAEVSVSNITAQGVSVGQNREAFEQLKKAVEEDTFYGTLYQKPQEWKDASEYVLLNYTLRIRNDCLVPIDMVEVQVVPQHGDILQMPDLAVHSLDLKSEGDLTVQILAPKDTHPIREMIVTYYVWGVSFSHKTTYGM